MVGLVLISFIVFADTVVWWKETNHQLTIIPLNWLRNALSAEGAADRAKFTLWQHPLVSMLWVMGPGLLFYGFRAAKESMSPAPPPVALPLDPEDGDVEEENTSRPPNRGAPGARGKHVTPPSPPP